MRLVDIIGIRRVCLGVQVFVFFQFVLIQLYVLFNVELIFIFVDCYEIYFGFIDLEFFIWGKNLFDVVSDGSQWGIVFFVFQSYMDFVFKFIFCFEMVGVFVFFDN